MPKFETKSVKSLNEPIEFEIDGRWYHAKNITPPDLADIQEILKNHKDDVGAVHRKQLAVFTGEDEESFANIDIRITGAILAFIMESIDNSIEEGRKKARSSR